MQTPRGGVTERNDKVISLKGSIKKLCLAGLMTSVLGFAAWGVANVVIDWVKVMPVAAQVVPLPPPVAPWTAIGASGTVDETSIPMFGFTNASALYGPNASVAPLEFRYNVVNTMHFLSTTGGIPTVTQPGWTTLEFGAQAPGTSVADAYLYRVDRCTGQQSLICWVRHVEQPAPGSCKVCQFPNTTFNFTSFLYYVRVILDRNTPNEIPAAHTLRIY
jgi:hypothetical protein